MSHQIAALQKRAVLAWIAVASLLMASIMPLLLSSSTVEAANITNRAVHISDSVAGATDVTYEVEFTVATTGALGVIVIQYCDDSPIIGDATCADARSFDWNEAGLVAAEGGTSTLGTASTSPITAVAVDDSTDSNGLVLTTTNGAGSTAGDVVVLTLGAGGGADGVTNPGTANSSFYLRIHTYDALTSVPCTTGGTCDGAGTDFDFDNASLGTTDDGGIALSTASQLTINARVQEVLTFTIGTDDEGDDCAILAGDTIDLGVLDSSGAINYASVDPTTDTNVGCAEVTTNAANGVQIFYIGNDLRVGAAVCSGSTDDDTGTASDVDLCINRDGDADNGTSTVIVGADEQWGIGVSNVGSNAGANITSNLAAEAAYDIDTPEEYSFTPNAATQIASSSTVVNQETIEIDAAGTASITTPTGLYSTTLTFIATATF